MNRDINVKCKTNTNVGDGISLQLTLIDVPHYFFSEYSEY